MSTDWPSDGGVRAAKKVLRCLSELDGCTDWLHTSAHSTARPSGRCTDTLDPPGRASHVTRTRTHARKKHTHTHSSFDSIRCPESPLPPALIRSALDARSRGLRTDDRVDWQTSARTVCSSIRCGCPAALASASMSRTPTKRPSRAPCCAASGVAATGTSRWR